MKLDFDGEEYRLASDQQKAWGRTLIAELGLRGDEKVLDLGCGDGALTAELAALVPNGSVLGIDASAGMIETARKHHARPGLQFALCDINTMDFGSQFDLVFSNATLHWIKDHCRMLSSVLRSLRDRGIARFQFAAEGNCSNLIVILRDVISNKRYAAYFDGFDWPWYMPSAEEYRCLLEQVPFAEKRVWIENADRYFENAEAMTKWIDQPSLVPFLACVAEMDRRPFRDAVVDRMIERTRRPDGTCFETFRRLNVLARK